MTRRRRASSSAGLSTLPSAQALFLFCDWPDDQPDAAADNGAWLQTLGSSRRSPTPTATDDAAAASPSPGRACRRWAWTADALATFSAPFREGMYQEDRLRRLGDRNGGHGSARSSRTGRSGAATRRVKLTIAPKQDVGANRSVDVGVRTEKPEQVTTRSPSMRCCCSMKAIATRSSAGRMRSRWR